MTDPKHCEQNIIDINAAIAERRHGKGKYAPVRSQIAKSDDKYVTLTTLETDGHVSTYENVLWGDEELMWVFCPSTLPSAASPQASEPRDDKAAGSPPLPGASGILYLTKDLLNSVVRAKQYDDPKWPYNLGKGVCDKKLQIWPTSLILTGRKLTNLTQSVTVDLLRPDLANPNTIRIEDGILTVMVTGLPIYETIGQLSKGQLLEALPEAASIIEKNHRDPGRLAYAWSVVAPCASMLEGRTAQSLSNEELNAVGILKKVLPEWGGASIE